MFDASDGNLLHTFLNPSGMNYEYFGGSIAAGSTAFAVGAPTKLSGQGKAYLFNNVTGNLMHTFQSPQYPIDDYFGYSVAMLGNNVLVGAPGNVVGSGNTPGTAYLFDGTTGQLLHTFADPAGQAGDLFGVSVAALGENILIGASRDDTAASNAGAAYLFDSTGNLLRTYYDPAGQPGDRFGYSVAAVGNDALISAFSSGEGGAVYLFQGQGVPEPSTLVLLGVGAVVVVAYVWRQKWAAPFGRLMLRK
jgi:hypothetical protein